MDLKYGKGPYDLLRRLRLWAQGDGQIPMNESDAMEAFNELDQWMTSGKLPPLPWDHPQIPHGVQIGNNNSQVNTF